MTLREKQEMEALYGKPGSGQKELSIPGLGEHVALEGVLKWLGLNYGDVTPIDGLRLRRGLWMIRYYDRYDLSVYALEFDGTGHVMSEMRAHIEDFSDDKEFYRRFDSNLTVY